MASVIVLGAKGRFGRNAVTAFEDAGWDVTALARVWPDTGSHARRVSLDVTDSDALERVCAGHAVIVNAVHPPYHQWTKEVPRITASVIAAARASGATVMIPGNLYNYGSSLPAVLKEETPWHGNTRKGEVRIRMENTFRDSGVRTIVLRAGDYFEGERTGNWLEDHIAAQAPAGKLRYPGPHDLPHAWAYLPDVGRALVGLAERRDAFDSFEEFGFAGYTLTGEELRQHVTKALARDIRFVPFPWMALRLMALGSPLMREVLEMRYLWRSAHSVDGAKLSAALPDFVPTPADKAFKKALRPRALASAA